MYDKLYWGLIGKIDTLWRKLLFSELALGHYHGDGATQDFDEAFSLMMQSAERVKSAFIELSGITAVAVKSGACLVTKVLI